MSWLRDKEGISVSSLSRSHDSSMDLAVRTSWLLALGTQSERLILTGIFADKSSDTLSQLPPSLLMVPRLQVLARDCDCPVR